MRNILNLIYVKEILGTALFENLHLYPQLQQQCNELLDIGLEYEINVLEQKEHQHLKKEVEDKIITIHLSCLGNNEYRQSLIYFDECGTWSDLI